MTSSCDLHSHLHSQVITVRREVQYGVTFVHFTNATNHEMLFLIQNETSHEIRIRCAAVTRVAGATNRDA